MIIKRRRGGGGESPITKLWDTICIVNYTQYRNCDFIGENVFIYYKITTVLHKTDLNLRQKTENYY